MEVVGDERPCEAVGLGLYEKAAEAGDKISAVVVIPKNVGSFDAAHDDMLKHAGDIESRLSWHVRENSRRIDLMQ
jgi:hypothetical protein